MTINRRVVGAGIANPSDLQAQSASAVDASPNEDDSFQWLGLMQHHGAPTRLLDFTWSPYVAAFFALERATDEAAVWAVSPSLLNDRRPPRKQRAKVQDKPKEMAPVIRRSAMAELYRMNISNATLFPGLDGLACSLAYELETHWAFDPITMKKRPGFYMEEQRTTEAEGKRNVADN